MSEPRPSAAPETLQTLDRGLAALAVLAETTGGLTPAELARHVGAPRTAGYRIVATLEAHGLVRRGADGRVHLGLGVLRLAAGVQPQLRAAATPVLRRLAEAVGATAHLTVADGPEALAVAVVEPTWTDFHVAYRVGSRHPLGAGAAGKAILQARSGEGDYALSEGELQPGAHGLAAPIRGVPGIEASVGVVSFAALDVARVAPSVRAAADEIAAALR